jgi:hypothetical protein
VASAGAVLSDGAAGAHQGGRAFVRQVGREGRERIGRASVRRLVMCLEVDRAIGQEVVGRAAAVLEPEPVGRAVVVLVAAAVVAVAAAVAAAVAPAAAAVAAAVAAADDPALTSVF